MNQNLANTHRAISFLLPARASHRISSTSAPLKMFSIVTCLPSFSACSKIPSNAVTVKQIIREWRAGMGQFLLNPWALTVECQEEYFDLLTNKQTPYREWNEPAVAHQDANQKEWWPLLSVCVRWRVVRYFQAFLRPLHQQVPLLAACFLPSQTQRTVQFALKASLRKIKAFQFI